MLEVVENFISLDDIKRIKEYYQNVKFENQGFHPERPDQIQWANCKLAKWILVLLHDKISKIIGDNFEISRGCGVFQRCYLPFGMHTDSKQRINPSRIINQNDSEGRALLIPLQEAVEFNTVFWNIKFATDQEKQTAFENFANLPSSQIANTKIGDQYDLKFAWQDPIRKLYNHYPVLGVYNWRLETAAVWDRNLLHAASDFSEKHAYKDAITIFFE